MKQIIEPKGKFGINLKELWDYRELFYFLAWRDIKVRYKQTVLGVAWAVLQPLLTMIVFTVFFGRIVGEVTGEVPYPIFAYTGLLFWQFFSTALTNSSNSFVGNQNIIQKIYFPRLIMPISATLASFIDFAMASVVFVGLLFYYKFVPSLAGVLLVAPAILISFIATSGLGLFLATLNVKYRDVRYALPFFVQLLLFLTPVIYPVSIVSEKYRWLLFLNPMSGVIENIRAGFLGTGAIDWKLLGISFLSSIVLFLLGYLFFYKNEREFADIV